MLSQYLFCLSALFLKLLEQPVNVKRNTYVTMTKGSLDNKIVALADLRGRQGRPRVQFLSFLFSFRENFGQIIGWRPHFGGWRPIWEILDPPLRSKKGVKDKYRWCF